MQYDFLKSELPNEKFKRPEISGITVFNTENVNYKKQPMFFGKPLGVQRYDSYKYPVFDKLTTQQLGYFWRPEEVSLQKDRGDYQTLSQEQKHIYTSNLKYQIMLDSIQGRGPGMAFIPYCSLPELEACMEVWGFMEMIHSRSYTYIIKNVYSDPSDVFDTIVGDQRILMTSSTLLIFMELPKLGSIKMREFLTHNSRLTMSNENSTEQSQTLTFLKVFASTLVLLVVSPLVNSSSWKDLLKSSLSSQETKTST
jgi:ribonucleotide reductase beta subunit family protein with ferritin-like domain